MRPMTNILATIENLSRIFFYFVDINKSLNIDERKKVKNNLFRPLDKLFDCNYDVGMNQKIFGTILKEKRERREITQSELAEMIGVTDVYISLIERDKRTPSIEVIKKLNSVIGTPRVCPTCGRKIKK
jgi:DNA-binding XRE family transcriptional regulator